MSLHTAINTNDHKQGSAEARVTLVEYGDYECPYCGEAYAIIKKLQKVLGDDLLFVFRNFPLTQMHPDALPAACLAEAAGLQGRFWQLHDLLYENQQDLSAEGMMNYAQRSGLNIEKLNTDSASEQVLTKIDSDIEGGARSGVNGTPTFFINGKRHNDDYEYSTLKKALDKALAEKSLT